MIFRRSSDGPDVILVDTSWFSTDYLAHQLTTRGARVQLIFPDRGSAEAMGRDLMADEPATRVHAAGYRQGLTL